MKPSGRNVPMDAWRMVVVVVVVLFEHFFTSLADTAVVSSMGFIGSIVINRGEINYQDWACSLSRRSRWD